MECSAAQVPIEICKEFQRTLKGGRVCYDGIGDLGSPETPSGFL